MSEDKDSPSRSTNHCCVLVNVRTEDRGAEEEATVAPGAEAARELIPEGPPANGRPAIEEAEGRALDAAEVTFKMRFEVVVAAAPAPAELTFRARPDVVVAVVVPLVAEAVVAEAADAAAASRASRARVELSMGT